MAQDQVLARGTGFLLTSGVPASLAFRPVAASSVTVADWFNIEIFRIDRQSSQKISCRSNPPKSPQPENCSLCWKQVSLCVTDVLHELYLLNTFL
jgi:hypothetical protein